MNSLNTTLTLTISSININHVNKFLGVYLDANLSWSKQNDVTA